MEKRIATPTPRTLRLGASILLLALALPGAALAFNSAYTSITMPGSFDSGAEWDTGTHELHLVSDYVWEGLVKVEKAGEFKFAANKSWDVSWGLGQDVSAVPTVDMGPLNTPDNIRLKIPSGTYRFVFFEDTETFSVLPRASDVPAYSSVQLVGNFNGDGTQTNGTMSAQGDGVWTTTVDLEYGATFRVLADGTAFGAHSVAGASVSEMPGTLALYGSTEAVLASRGGTFVFTADFRSNMLSIVQTATNDFTVVAAGASGTFACGDKDPGQNLEDQGGGWWQGDFIVEQTNFTLYFVGRDENGQIGRWWGFPSGTVVTSYPASGKLDAVDEWDETLQANFRPGGTKVATNYFTFRFNPFSGEYSVQKRLRANLFQNPSFETLTANREPAKWGLYHAASSGTNNAFDVHSGRACAVLNRLYDDWENLGNIDQSIVLKNLAGLPFRISAAFRCGGDKWSGDTVRIIVEWKDSSGKLLQEESAEVLNLGPAWQTSSLETKVPGSNVTAHVLFKYDGAVTGETVLIDDAFAGVVAGREQNFDAWGAHDSFGPLSPDWSATSAKTILNAAENIRGGVVISRYIESQGNTKAIEIYNGTATAINLKTSPYYLQQYDNGSSTPTVTIPLTNGTIPANRTFAVTRTFEATNYPPDPALKNFGAIGGISTRILRTDALTFNGDDVIVLRKGSETGDVVDRVGQVSPNASGSLWSRMASDHTLVRNGIVTNGNTGAVTDAFDLSEWTVLENGDFGDLGAHAFVDPDAGYLPTGYSLLLNTGASLSTPSLDGGVGDIAFLARAQAAPGGKDLVLLVETAPDEYSTAWTLVSSNAIPASQTAFMRYECVATNTKHTVVRFRHVSDGTTNRVRLDDISVDRAYSVKRTENFADWTDAAFRTDGVHTHAQWTLCGRITTNGVTGTLGGTMPVDSGYVRSPTFAGGVGNISFSLCRPATTDSVQVTLETSDDGGSIWNTVQSFDFAAGGKQTSTNLSAWVHIPSNGCVRFSCTGGTADATLDNIYLAMPVLSREVTFDDFSVDSKYLSRSYNGWTFTDLAILGDVNAWSGNSGLLRNGTVSSPKIDAIGTISFMCRMGPYSGDDKTKLKIETSADGVSWNVLTNGLPAGRTWQAYTYQAPAGSDWHYVRFTQLTKDKRILLDDINLGEFSEVPTVLLSSELDPINPSGKKTFRLTATAYPRNDATLLAVTGSVKFASGRWTNLVMTSSGAGQYVSAALNTPSPGNSISFYATAWYSGAGVVPGNPGIAVTNVSTAISTVLVTRVESGSVWINEICYERVVPPDTETDDGGEYGIYHQNQDHEFIELCGKSGIDIGNWKIQLAYATAYDIGTNQAIYATYTIAPGTVISDNPETGHGFYLLADTYFTNAPVNQWLTKLVPADDDGWNSKRSHIHDWTGVIRLVDQYGAVVQSISYGTYSDGSERLPVSQQTGQNNKFSLSLGGSGSDYSGFSWRITTNMTPGEVNAGQTPKPDTPVSSTNLLPVWHNPALAGSTGDKDFFLLDPANARQSDAVQMIYAYTNNDFDHAKLGGTLYHSREGSGIWSEVGLMSEEQYANPTNGEAYVFFTPLAPYSYKRLDTMRYVIEATTTLTNYSKTYLGSTGDGVTCKRFATLQEAQESPFLHIFRTADVLTITNLVFLADGKIRIDTIGDDSEDPLSEFDLMMTTNLVEWTVLPTEDYTRVGTNEVDIFTIETVPPGPLHHFYVQPVR